MNLSKIVSIEYVGDQDVIDIEVSGNHLFYANGILTHNSAIEATDLNQSHIQGGMSKINTSDYVVGIKQDDLMRAAGEIWFQIMKSRNSGGVGKKILLAWDQISLLIQSLKKQLLPLKTKSQVLSTSGTTFNKPAAPAGILNLFEEGK